MKQLYAALCGLFIHASLVAGNPDQLSYAHYAQRPKNPLDELIAIQQLSNQGAYNDAHNQYLTFLNHQYNDPIITSQTSIGYLNNLAHLLGSSRNIKDSESAYTQALQLFENLNDQLKPHVYKAIGTIYQHLSTAERRHFIRQFHTGITYAPMFNACGEPMLSFDLCKKYIKKEQPNDASNIVVRLGLGSSYLQLLHTQNGKSKDLKIVEEKLSEVCALRNHEKMSAAELTNIHIHTWHMLAEISAKTAATHRNAVHCWINSLYEYYNQYGHINVHVLDPEQISTFASFIRNNKDCQNCLHDLSKELDSSSQAEFLYALFSYASAHSADGAWLLKQYEVTSHFSSLWHTYVQRQDEISKQDLQDIIKACMHDQEKRDYLLNACTESEQKRFIWEAIFNQAKDLLRYEAALQQAKLTDNMQKKALLLNLAVTQHVPQALNIAFSFCKEVGCSNQTATLCKAIITHASDKDMDMITWLEQMNDNDHAHQLLKVLADKGNADAQFKYGSSCQKRYKKDRSGPEAQSLKKLATTYLTKAQQNKKLDTKARLKLAYFAYIESDIMKLEELIGALAHDENPKAQQYFARAYHSKVCTAALDPAQAIASANQLTKQPNKHKIKQVHDILRDREHAIQWFNKAIKNTSDITKKLNLQCDFAAFHLNFGEIYTNHAITQKPHAACLQETAKQSYTNVEKIINDILAVDAKHSRAHTLLGMLYKQFGNFDKATASLLKAYRYDPSTELSHVLMDLCNTIVQKASVLDCDKLVSRLATDQLSKKLFELFANQQITLSNEHSTPIRMSEGRIERMVSEEYKKQKEKLINLIRSTIPQSENLISSFEKDYESLMPKIIRDVSSVFIKTTSNIHSMAPIIDLAHNVVQEIISNALDTYPVRISLIPLSAQQILSIAQTWHKNQEDASSKSAKIITLIKHARELTDALLALEPNNTNALNLKGICEKCQNSKKSKNRAIQYFTKAAQNGSIDALFNLANLYRDITDNEERPVFNSAYIISDQTRDKSRLKLAEETYKKVLAQDQTYAAAWYNLSLVQLGQGNDKESFSSCQEAAKLNEAKAYYRLAEYLLGGYGGCYDISLAIENLHIAKALFTLNEQYDMAYRSEILTEIANYQASNYIQNYINVHIQKFFPEQKNITKAIMEAASSIGQWIHAQPNLDIKNMAQESHNLLQKALHEKSIAYKQELYQTAKTLFMQALGIHEFDAAQHRLEEYTAQKHPLSIRQEAFAAKGLLHFHQGKAAVNPELKKKHQKFALKYLEQLHAYDVHHYNTARQLFQHVTAALDSVCGLHQPEQLSADQKQSFDMIIKELDFIINDLIAFQPNNYFVGRALAHAAFVQKQMDNPLKARQLLQLGHDNNHILCSLQLARGYESGSLTINNQPDLHLAKVIIKEALQNSDPHNQFYQHAAHDLLILQQKLGDIPSEPHNLQFLEKFNQLAQKRQKQNYDNCAIFFTTWGELQLIDKQECLALINTTLDEKHTYFGMQKTLLKLFPKIQKLSSQKQYETVCDAYQEWTASNQEGRMELKIIGLTFEERDAIYAEMKL